MGIVTLTTDFGTSDGYVGAMKGVILALAPAAQVVDLTHDIPRHDVAAGAFALAQAVPFFPSGTVHVAVVDPGVGGRRQEVVVAARGQLFVGPDNGLFCLAATPVLAAHEISAPGFRRDAVAATFHGRDVFAHAAGRLARGSQAADAGPPVELEGSLAGRPPRVSRDGRQIVGRIVHIDRFGNLVSDIPAARLDAGTRVRVGRLTVSGLARTFEDVAPGRPLAYAGSAGTLELAVREGSAARRYGVRRGAAVTAAAPSASRADPGRGLRARRNQGRQP